MEKTKMNAEYKPEKIRVSKADIIVTGTKEKPYFEIDYYDIGKKEEHIGFSSYCLSNVFDWREEYMEMVKEVK